MNKLKRSDYKSATATQTDALLADRGRIDSSHRMLDDTLKCVLVLDQSLTVTVKHTLPGKILHRSGPCLPRWIREWAVC